MPAETIIQSIINDTLGVGVVALTTPAASNWFLGAFTQSRDATVPLLVVARGQVVERREEAD